MAPNSSGSNKDRSEYRHPAEAMHSHVSPTSTMAAQLIKTLTAAKPARQIEQDDLQKLMSEVSSLENSPVELTDLETKLEHKHKLIYVFARAVLERLSKDDPFVNNEQLVSQCSEALDVFISTITEFPTILVYVPKLNSNLYDRGQQPLWLWLFPRVLTLLSNRLCDSLVGKVKVFFVVSCRVTSRSSKLWGLVSSFLSYLKECGTAVISQQQLSCLRPIGSSLRIAVPSVETLQSIISSDRDLSQASLGQCSPGYVVSNTIDGLRATANTISIMVDISVDSEIPQDAIIVSQSYLVWVLDSFLTLYELQKTTEKLTKCQFIQRPDILIFSTVYGLLSRLREVDTILCKGSILLCIILKSIIEDLGEAPDNGLQQTLCNGIVFLNTALKQHESVLRAATLYLLPVVVVKLMDKATCIKLGNEIEESYRLFREGCDATQTDSIIFRGEATIKAEPHAAESNIEPLQTPDDKLTPPSKRRKLDFVGPDTIQIIISNLTPLIGDNLDATALTCFEELNDEDRCSVIRYLCLIPCATAGSLTLKTTNSGNIVDPICYICDGNKIPPIMKINENNPRHQNNVGETRKIIEELIRLPAFFESRRPRIVAMASLKSFTIHSNHHSLIDLEHSKLGQWCLQSLQSSIRELRIAAGRTLPNFLQQNECNDQSNHGHQRADIESHEIIRRNRLNALSILRSLSEKDSTHLQETCILAWAQLARIFKDEELNIVLLKLVDYLGHKNPIISGVAFIEILKVSKAKNVSPERMLREFWPSIAIMVVKDLLVKPQTSQLMADLLDTTVPEFLIMTQTYTLPWLVLMKKEDVIHKISQARKDEEVWMMCMEITNIAPILSLLLIQEVPDTQAFIMSLLKNVKPRFDASEPPNKLEYVDLMGIEPATLVFHLLKAAGDGEAKRSKIRSALQYLANQAYPDSNDSESSLGGFLEQHILGLVARLSEAITDFRDEQSFSERRRCVRALEEMVVIGKSYTRTARPQICACLQSALSQPELQASAFSAWDIMLRSLNDEDVETMLESTFSIIIQHYNNFDLTTKSRVASCLDYLRIERSGLIKNNISSLPSLELCHHMGDISEKFDKLRNTLEVTDALQIFARRANHENPSVVAQAFTELRDYLRRHQSFLQASAVSEQPDAVIGFLIRSILDACLKFSDSNFDIAQMSAECIGLIGCLDSNRVDFVREQREMVVVSNFHDPKETVEFVLFLLEDSIVPAFLSATDTSVQGFLSFVMQELLVKCSFTAICGPILRNGERNSSDPLYKRWLSLPTSIQNTLTPFLSSRYMLRDMTIAKAEYPIFQPNILGSERMFNNWLKTFVLDLLQRPQNINANQIYSCLYRAIRIKEISIASFLLPYVVQHVVVEGNDNDRLVIGQELLTVLEYDIPEGSHIKADDIKSFREAIFRVIDYLHRWIQTTHSSESENNDIDVEHIRGVLDMIPAEIISRCALECKSYSRALFYWEEHIRQAKKTPSFSASKTSLFERLQDIYTQIDEPDGIEGISSLLHVLDVDQQILGHRKAGRWTAAQSWYEIKLAENPKDIDIQLNLLACLKESGQHDILLNYVEGMHTGTQIAPRLLPYAAEAAWVTGRWPILEKYTSIAGKSMVEDFNINVGNALLALYGKEEENFNSCITAMRHQIASSFSRSSTSSLAACQDQRLKLHVLTELDMIAGSGIYAKTERSVVIESLDRRLEVIGGYYSDKQYLLGIRRAAMQLSNLGFTSGDIASSWLASARLARKGNAVHQSFNAVLHASKLGDESATIEHARLLWKDGHHRKAIQNLQGAIENGAFISHDHNSFASMPTGVDEAEHQNLLTARAHLLLAKWLDSAGQTQSSALRYQYQIAAKTHMSWERGHYYLGRHYYKLIESEKALNIELQSDSYLIGEMSKLVIENYLRSLIHGTKYIYQTLPRIITLWLDLGTQVCQPLDQKQFSKEAIAKITKGRKDQLAAIHSKFGKYITKMPAYIFYTALPQIVARIAHPNNEVYQFLQHIIYKVVLAHPQQALWSVLAVCTSTQSERKQRGATILQALRAKAKRSKFGDLDIKAMIMSGEHLTNQLLQVCNSGKFSGSKTITASLTKDLRFDPELCLPSPLSVPVEKLLMATLPTLTDTVATHKAFSRDSVTLSSFKDDVLILSSLQKPRKLTARGSDGKSYGLLCKPKDDLRKDQRLMEFNSMINRSFKRDAESSRRQLYIKTYAVTPLNEECGLIEWVDGLKTLREILLSSYKRMGISPIYREIEVYCDEACKDVSKIPFFTEKVLGQFPPVLHSWFVQQFPEPTAWFAARLRYTRSCAVMSMAGTILGLGDRHGENILFEEGNGGTFHVDFNCLFDKGLTFAKPERVPFRLTHNMVDAMGIYGYEGPFRKSSELTLSLLRQHQDTLMTILESFIYDPTLDLLVKKNEKKKREGASTVPNTAQGVLDSIKRKVKGLLPGETVPLGVEGQVDELIKQATDPQLLAAMYIGWCSFL